MLWWWEMEKKISLSFMDFSGWETIGKPTQKIGLAKAGGFTS